MQELLQRLQQRSSALSAPDVRRMLQALYRERDLWQAAGACERPFPQFAELIEALRELGYLKVRGRALELTPAGRVAFERWRVALSPPVHTPCPQCTIGPAPLPHLQQKFAQIAQQRPSAALEFEQGFLTEESVIRRVAWLDRCGDLAHREIVLLGDDDLLSVALALTERPAQIVVFEIDQRLVDFLNEHAQQRGWPLKAYLHDLRRPLPEKFFGSFDVFVTDPLETVDGFLLFVEQGLSLLKPGAGQAGYFGLTKIEASPEKWRLFEQKLLERHDLFISDVLRDFGFYENWPYLTETVSQQSALFSEAPDRPWYRSTFFRVETLGAFHPVRCRSLGEEEVEIYYDQDSIMRPPRR
ncbi:MAG: bis-aminopropyl spermidine synthase family protein [Candidatus Bipolaricaulota bacterium]|nr:bis-aminopropyl spermidine synthase family protein [Candidatus Bipolaricaulota bacterium]MCS7274587.1 bis-aminopropyl spermidine synthase family protein [Candidatus Bipolaricaulota bacterium]MDW8110982.1 bis-aminopropyl spermidine synthase family protein [Candidatus Bipolaricaulota bacterium]MDW8329017.1 bis-aminopropyl spermidine synthase family protein [Candidatus Bipolaricaulota bacterium]